jgi:hypothetical protein
MARRATKGDEKPAGGEDAANESERRGQVFNRTVSRAEAEPPVLALEPDSQVEIRLATNDPNVTIILLHESKGVSQ